MVLPNFFIFICMIINAKPCDIIFFRDNRITGKVIRWWTTSQFDHVEIALGNENSIGAKPKGGVQIRPLSVEKDSKWCVCRPVGRLTNKQKNNILNFAHSQIGKKYDYLGILGFAIDRNIEDSNRWFCSEFVDKCFDVGEYTLVPRKNESQIPPELLFQSLAIKPVYSNFIKI